MKQLRKITGVLVFALACSLLAASPGTAYPPGRSLTLRLSASTVVTKQRVKVYFTNAKKGKLAVQFENKVRTVTVGKSRKGYFNVTPLKSGVHVVRIIAANGEVAKARLYVPVLYILNAKKIKGKLTAKVKKSYTAIVKYAPVGAQVRFLAARKVTFVQVGKKHTASVKFKITKPKSTTVYAKVGKLKALKRNVKFTKTGR